MKRIRFGSALMFVVLALGFALASGPSSSAAEEAAPKCSCMYPNGGSYGVRTADDCAVKDCWIDLNNLQ